jgi:hypothetical protein
MQSIAATLIERRKETRASSAIFLPTSKRSEDFDHGQYSHYRHRQLD